MTDLLQILPDFDQKPFSHLLPSLDKALITVTDILTLDPADVAKRAQLPTGELKKLAPAVVEALHRQLGFAGKDPLGSAFLSGLSDGGDGQQSNAGLKCISTLDEGLDAALNGGIPAGYLAEVTGERYASIPSDVPPDKTLC